MPIPLVAIGLAGAGTAATVFVGWRLKKDKKQYDDCRSRYEDVRQQYTSFISDLNAEIDDLTRQRLGAEGTLHAAAEFLVRANVRDRDFSTGSGITLEKFEEMKDAAVGLIDFASSIGGGIAAGGVLGAAARAGAYAAARAFGTAGTGAAISGLTGAAARNAMLAWLGGGTLAAGGGGVAAGVGLLTNIAAAPLALLPPIVIGVKAVRQRSRIHAEIAKMEVAEAVMSKHTAELAAVQSRVKELSSAVAEVEDALKTLLASASEQVMEDLYKVAHTAKKLAELLDVNWDTESETDRGDTSDDAGASQSC